MIIKALKYIISCIYSVMIFIMLQLYRGGHKQGWVGGGGAPFAPPPPNDRSLINA